MKIRELAVLLVVGSVASACGGDDDGSGYDINHATVQQALSSNSHTMAEGVVNNLQMLEDSRLIGQGLEMFASEDCLVVEGSGADFDSGACETTAPTLDTESMREGSDELIQILESRVFASGNIESQSSKAVTYLMRGSVVCADDGGVDQECAQTVDDLQLRIYVTSPEPGDLDLALQFGPNRHTPLLLEVHSDRLAAEVDLSEVKAAVSHIAMIAEEGIELPDTMRGRVRAELLAESPNRMSAQVSVVQAVQIANDDIAVSVGAATPALRVTLDGGARAVELAANLGEIAVQYPDTHYSYDPLTDAETETKHIFNIFVAGVSAATTLQADLDRIQIDEISLGNATSTFSVDGAQVVAVDLNAQTGRALSAMIEAIPGGDDLFDITVEPEFDLRVAMNFADGGPDFDDVDPWMLDDVLHIALNGAAAPKMQIGEDGMKLVEGALTVSLENAGSVRTLSAGQCMGGESSQAGTGIDQPAVPVSSNPVEDLRVISCN